MPSISVAVPQVRRRHEAVDLLLVGMIEVPTSHRGVNSAVECFLHTEEVASSILARPTVNMVLAPDGPRLNMVLAPDGPRLNMVLAPDGPKLAAAFPTCALAPDGPKLAAVNMAPVPEGPAFVVSGELDREFGRRIGVGGPTLVRWFDHTTNEPRSPIYRRRIARVQFTSVPGNATSHESRIARGQEL